MYFGLCAPVSMGSLQFRGQAFASHGHGEVRDEEVQLHGGLGENLNLDCKSEHPLAGRLRCPHIWLGCWQGCLRRGAGWH